MIVEVSTHGSTIRRKRERFIIENKIEDGGIQKTEIPAEKIDSIIVTANAMISTQATKLCIEKQIQLVLANYNGKPFARMWTSTPGRATEIRRRQYLNFDTVTGRSISRNIVLEKIKSQKKLLLDLKNNRRNTCDDSMLQEFTSAIDIIDATKEKIKNLEIETSNFKQLLLGFEGYCATKYFGVLSSCLPQKWQFYKRSQNPGLDAFNASLNYMYGMGYSSVEKTIILSGLDPNAGFYHADSYGKPTLAFDIIEVCRPIIDRTLLSIFTKKIVREDWFEKELEGMVHMGIRITKSGRLVLLSKYKEESVKQVEKLSWDYCRKIIDILNDAKVGDVSI